jgi:hydroxylamine reductase
MSNEQMFCYQCEQTAKGQGCTIVGVCGKTPDVAALQDLLIYLLRGVSQLAMDAEKVGVKEEQLSVFTCKALFATLTNVNFDAANIVEYIKKAAELREQLKMKIQATGAQITVNKGPVTLMLGKTKEDLIEQGRLVGIKSDPEENPDLHSLHWLLTYGLKGVAAYTYHAYLLGKKDPAVFAFVHRGLSATLDKSLGVNEFVALVMKCGEVNLRAMELLDAGNTETFGHPVPTKVSLGARKGKAIMVSGHDLIDLEEVLKQSQGKGIFVYTHGEMLPAHGYPKLKAYSPFLGHYGTAWQNQQREFAKFPGAILMTTNCIQKPLENYKGDIFTSGPVSWPGTPHIEGKDFSLVIDKALELPGFQEDMEGKYVTVGYGRTAVLNIAGKVVDAVKNGHIKRFLLVGGCDGAKPGRSYYTEFVEKAPRDTIVLTLACGKFRFFDKDLGSIDEIPRLLDMGQCNDAYSAVKVAQALANAFGVQVNDLPLSLVLSWYEQKAVAVLLSLLYLGIKNIRIGPSLPAFITPNILKVLIEKFNIMPITTVDADLKAIMA